MDDNPETYPSVPQQQQQQFKRPDSYFHSGSNDDESMNQNDPPSLPFSSNQFPPNSDSRDNNLASDSASIKDEDSRGYGETDVQMKDSGTKEKKKRGRKRKNVDSSPDEEDDQNDDDENDENEEAKQLYCICRSSKTDKFMICCDKCEEWFHGHCVNITQTFSKKIQNYYCPPCCENDSTLEIKYKDSHKPKKEKVVLNDTNVDNLLINKENGIQLDNFKSNAINNDFEEEENYSPVEDEFSDDEDDEEFAIGDSEKKKRVKKRKYRKADLKNQDKNSKAKQRGRKKGQDTKTKVSKARGRRRNDDKKSHEHSHRRSRHKANFSDDSGEELKAANLPRHCYGPGCINSSRKGSKYCCDECGERLATNRIMEILPQQRNQGDDDEGAAYQLFKKELDDIRREQNQTSEHLDKIDRDQFELDTLITRAKSSIPFSEEVSNDIIENEQDSDYIIHCFICSQDISLKIALKHMERCYNKTESRTSYGSYVKTNIEGQTVFCDFYNPTQRSYCKRLRILCPEHSKEPKIADNEVCGCPLPSEENPFADSTDSFCQILRKKCNRHYGWEKFRQADLDSQRFQDWLKLDELFERKQKISETITNRNGVLQLMLHRTTMTTTTAAGAASVDSVFQTSAATTPTSAAAVPVTGTTTTTPENSLN